MERAVSVSRHDRCPICGKSDWCRFLPANSKVPGARMVNCKRDTVFQDQVSSVDGRTYIFIKKCNDLSSLYIEEEIRRKEQEIWRQEHGCNAKSRKENSIKKDRKQPVVWQRPEEFKVHGACKPLDDQKLDGIYRRFLSLLRLNTGHRTYLLKERWAKELIEKSLARSLPSVREYTPPQTNGRRRYRSRREITEEFLKKMSGGIYLEELDQRTRECAAEQTGKYTFRIILTQGLNRQIKRMCAACGYRVRSLKRIRVMHITLGDLKPGEYRKLEDKDVECLYRDCGLTR